MKINYLTNDEKIIRTIATWLYNEFLTGNPNASIERLSGLLLARAHSTNIPFSLVAFNSNNEPIGVVSVMPKDMKNKEHLSPWLAGLYVTPDARGTGVGLALCDQVKKELLRLKIPKAYLCTSGQEKLYIRAGWKAIETENYDGKQVSVMKLVVA